ncbi:MAG TPA: hypothetical protein VGS06_02535 [Streptosporangiaceae bacterium]|nr:hypothetical protein [Streptosporangiaceae bacterium]
MTGPPSPDDQPPGNGQLRYPGGAGHLGDADSVEAQRTMLASFWALVLRRFRAYVQRDAVAGRDPRQEGR